MGPAEFIRPKETKIWPHGRRAVHRNGGAGRAVRERVFSLEPHSSVSPSLRAFKIVYF